MTQIGPAFITSTGSFLPGPPIGNAEMEAVLGQVGEAPSRLRPRILASNGIVTRHYALDREQRTTHQNSELAARACESCLRRSNIDGGDVDLLAVGSTQGDLPLPGLASMVQAALGVPACEILSTHGVCSAGLQATKAAFNQVRLGEKHHALVCGSELASRLLKRQRYQALGRALDRNEAFEAEFLRWMLSDGSGALLIESKPRPRGVSLRIEWVEIISFASDFPVCMYCGSTQRPASPASWQDYDTYADAERDGALLLRQDLRLLENIVKVGVEGYLKLAQAGRVVAREIDHFVCHYSSHYFRGKLLDLMKLTGCLVPEERWFTNLYTKGNTGSAAFFIMLDELFESGKLLPGQTVFCVVPESGRFAAGYMKLTVVEGTG